jgi:hypothetical protein
VGVKAAGMWLVEKRLCRRNGAEGMAPRDSGCQSIACVMDSSCQVVPAVGGVWGFGIGEKGCAGSGGLGRCRVRVGGGCAQREFTQGCRVA